jgi:hypothetical protein
MQYLRARYYDQGTGVFSSLDSFGGNNGDPQSLHKYAYCHGDPVNGIDPSGEFFFTLADMLAAVTVGMTLEVRHARAVLRTGTRLLERAFRYITNFAIRNLPRDRDNAAIVIHGVAPHEYGYATDFISELEGRVTNQDWYEFIWSGFALTGAVVPNMISHHEAVGSFREAMLTLQGKGYRKVNVLAHSWGTVISRDVLLGGVGPVNTWVTMGSPLPGDTPWPPGLQYWLNASSPDDPIVYLGPVLGATGVMGGTGFLFNSLLPDQIGISGGHSSYWNNAFVLDTISARLSLQ